MSMEFKCLPIKKNKQKDSSLRKRILCSAAGFTLANLLAVVTIGSVLAAEKMADARFPVASEFQPSWPAQKKAPKGAPNVLVIMTDDVGFAASSTFGGPVPTTAFSDLAKSGLKYNNFHTTSICSATRASLLTGRNPHSVGMGTTTSTPSAFPGYSGVLPKSAATIAEVLKQNGYNTAMFGKHHLAPEWELTPAGPFDRWPTGLGFEHYYGFLNADTDQFKPTLIQDKTPVPVPNDPGYILDKDLADRTIDWMHRQKSLAPDKPFFIYYAPGSAHAPHQAPKEWVETFKGKFDQGWDKVREESFARQKEMGVIPADAKLTPRPSRLPAWDSLTQDQRRLAARFMEVYAAQLSYCDEQIGRIIQNLRDTGQFDNTLIIYIQGDNGAAGEGALEGVFFEASRSSGLEETSDYKLAHIDELGGPKTFQNYPAPWAWAMTTPFQWYKQIASHFGGTRNGMVISRPSRIGENGGLRSQFSYISDIAPTILEEVGIKAPAIVNGERQQPIDGISLSYSFQYPAAKSRRHTQYFETFQNVGIYKDGWTAGTTPQYMPWELGKQESVNLNTSTWELYNVDTDFSQSTNLANENPQKLAELKAAFVEEAERNKVFPVHAIRTINHPRPSLTTNRTEFEYYPGTTGIYQDATPQLNNRSFEITADVEITKPNSSGVLIAMGGHIGGYSFYLEDGLLNFTYNAVPVMVSTISSSEKIGLGKHKLTVRLHKDKEQRGTGGEVTLLRDDKIIGTGRVERTKAGNLISHTEGLDVGMDLQTPVSDTYSSPAKFEGNLSKVKITLK